MTRLRFKRNAKGWLISGPYTIRPLGSRLYGLSVGNGEERICADQRTAIQAANAIAKARGA